MAADRAAGTAIDTATVVAVGDRAFEAAGGRIAEVEVVMGPEEGNQSGSVQGLWPK